MTRLTKSFTTFETEVELRGVRYVLFAEVDVMAKQHSIPIVHFGSRSEKNEMEYDLEVSDWSATDAGGHEITDRDLKAELRAELGLQIIAKRERILDRV